MSLDWPPDDTPVAGAEYARYAEIYDVLFEALGVDIRFYIEGAAALLQTGDTILELGTGTGRLTQPLLEAGYRVVGVDPSPHMLDRADARLAHFGERIELHATDAQSMKLARRFPLAVAPYAMVAHLYTDADRIGMFRSVFDHLEPGGTFIFNDMPSWLAGPADGSTMELYRTGLDPATGLRVRLMTNSIDVAEEPFTVRYDFVDWMNEQNEVARRMIVRVRFRNISLDDELSLLRAAGFETIELLGGFDGRPFCHADHAQNTRLIFRCQRPL